MALFKVMLEIESDGLRIYISPSHRNPQRFCSDKLDPRTSLKWTSDRGCFHSLSPGMTHWSLKTGDTRKRCERWVHDTKRICPQSWQVRCSWKAPSPPGQTDSSPHTTLQNRCNKPWWPFLLETQDFKRISLINFHFHVNKIYHFN